MKLKLLLVFFVFCEMVVAQNRNSVWCFGDSAGIDFSTSSPTFFTSSCLTRGSSCSISNSLGNLLFYANTRATFAGNSGKIWNATNQLMQMGDSIVGEGWYQEMVITNKPGDDSLYYLFSIGVTGSSMYGLYYSLINMNGDNGNGVVAQKNIQLNNLEAVDCINAIKHGNGRDWWLIFRKSDFNSGGSNNDYYVYLISPQGISSPYIITVGSLNSTNLGNTSFSKAGDKLLFTNYKSAIEVFNFDRCTGGLTNPITISNETAFPFANYIGSAFSPNGRFIYVATNDDTSRVYQYDLLAPNISASKQTIAELSYPVTTGGSLRLAPDDKIYWSCFFIDTVGGTYPYADSVYNMYNMNLCTINYPDSAGSACGFTPFSFYLGGNRAYWGLPNNPDYELAALAGSPCDTLTSISPTPALPGGEGALFVYYHAGWEVAFINAKGLRGKKYAMVVYDVLGKIIFKEEGKLSSEYFTKDLRMQGMGKGVYLVFLQTEKEKLVRKFVKE